MSNSVEKTGKTVDAAVFSALEELGATIDEVIVEVLEEPDSGILGIGRKPARVLVTLDRLDDESYALPEADDETQYDLSEPVLNGKTVEDPGLFSNEEIDTLNSELVSQSDYYGDDSDYLDEANEEVADKAVAYIETVLEGLDIDAQVRSYYKDSVLHVDVEGGDVGALIGRRGDTLNALQYLLSLVVNQEGGERRRVQLDVASYRKRREQTLVDLALRTASRVMKVGKDYVMEEMPASERRVIHATLQNHKGVRTTSEGQEPHRYVVVIPLKKANDNS